MPNRHLTNALQSIGHGEDPCTAELAEEQPCPCARAISAYDTVPQ
jgi:hypothetical protein